MWTILLVAGLVLFAWILSSRIGSPRMLPIAGAIAPDFSLKSQDGDTVALKDYRDKWVVLYFYPRDMTPGCTIEAHNFQRDQAEYAKRNAIVLGVSVDSADSHRKFCAKEGLYFKLLGDTSGEVSKQYGSLMNFGVTKISARNTFLIDPKGRIARTFARVEPSGHSAQLLSELDELQKTQLQIQ